MIILIIGNKKKYSSEFDPTGQIGFNKSKDIWDINDLIRDIQSLEIDKIKVINDFLSKELSEKVYALKKTQSNEIETIIKLVSYISQNRDFKEKKKTVIDPNYKIYNRFKKFADKLISRYTTLGLVYEESLEIARKGLEIDEAQDLIMMLYLQDISIQMLEEAHEDPIKALEKLVNYFEEKISEDGKRYDRAAISFFLINEMIKCNVFPNERSE